MAAPQPPPPQPQPPPPPPSMQQPPDYASPNYSIPTGQPVQQPMTHQYSTDGGGVGLGDSLDFRQPEPLFKKLAKTMNTRYQLFLDAITPHKTSRWTFSLVILLIFMVRIIFAQGCPKIDPAFAAYVENDIDSSDSGPMLPTRARDEFRPFIRRLPEFKFWLSATTATLISLFLTLFEVFDLPVFWPILLLYFILLFISTMRQQIQHMIRYGYVPWDKGKKRYGRQASDQSTI